MTARLATIAPLVVVLAITMPARAQQQPSPLAASTTAECKATWAAADINKDGVLTDDELKDYRAVLDAIDTNRDGRLSKAEFDAACNED